MTHPQNNAFISRRSQSTYCRWPACCPIRTPCSSHRPRGSERAGPRSGRSCWGWRVCSAWSAWCRCPGCSCCTGGAWSAWQHWSTARCPRSRRCCALPDAPAHGWWGGARLGDTLCLNCMEFKWDPTNACDGIHVAGRTLGDLMLSISPNPLTNRPKCLTSPKTCVALLPNPPE